MHDCVFANLGMHLIIFFPSTNLRNFPRGERRFLEVPGHNLESFRRNFETSCVESDRISKHSAIGEFVAEFRDMSKNFARSQQTFGTDSEHSVVRLV